MSLGGPSNKDPLLKRIEALLALATARAAAAGAKQRLVLQSTDNIPAGPGPATIFVGQGVTGVPAPATYTSKTGNVRVTIQVSVSFTQTDFLSFQPVRDNGTIDQADVGTVAATTGSAPEGGSACATLVVFDSVTPGTAHAWGVSIVASQAFSPNSLQVQAGQFQISIEDL